MKVKLKSIELYNSPCNGNINCHAIESLLILRYLEFSTNIDTRITDHLEGINYLRN